jgi:hypothetical protein
VVHQQKRSQNYSLLACAFTICYHALFVLSTLLIAKKGKRKKGKGKEGKKGGKSSKFLLPQSPAARQPLRRRGGF